MKIKKRRVWYVTLLGRPSSGKSSFVNTVIGDKISIISSVPQTTRRLIRGIYTDDNCQIIFQDVPWLHSSNHTWNQSINAITKNALAGSDLILRVIDGSREKWEEERLIDAIIEKSDTPSLTIVSKADLLRKKEREKFPEWTIFISNISREWIDDCIKIITEKLPEWPLLYPESDITDQDVYTRVSEFIREKIFLTTFEEIPHDTYVEIESMEDLWKLVKILAYIYCKTDSQKKILIGSLWSKIKEIGSLARKDLQDLFEKKVYLDVHIKVQKDWQNRDSVTRKVLWKM